MTQPEQSIEIAKLIVGNFIERRDVKAKQTTTGAYMPVRENMKNTDSPTIPWSLQDAVDHVDGVATYGHYLVSLEGTCRCIVFDIDLRAKANPTRQEEPILFNGEEIDPREVWAGPASPAKRDLALQLRTIAEGFARTAHKLLDCKTMVSYSGSKGMHAYVCLDRGTSAEDARDAANTVIDGMPMGSIVSDRGDNFFKHETGFKAISIEVFPKQDHVKEGGFGNLIRLPLGVNLKGKAGFFLDLSVPQDQFKIDDPILALTNGSLR